MLLISSLHLIILICIVWDANLKVIEETDQIRKHKTFDDNIIFFLFFFGGVGSL